MDIYIYIYIHTYTYISHNYHLPLFTFTYIYIYIGLHIRIQNFSTYNFSVIVLPVCRADKTFVFQDGVISYKDRILSSVGWMVFE